MATQPPTSISWPLTLFPATLGTSFRFRPSIPLLLSASRRIAAATAGLKNIAKPGAFWFDHSLSSRAEDERMRGRSRGTMPLLFQDFSLYEKRETRNEKLFF